ncbi:MAG: hypothetical protein F6J90_04835 [Moorea sp. SIOASIH]|uniref:hypothetical protein n=1 Tax=Moorena sp. SIOASIH TaxID=2607817 RepID=UPI0013BBBF3D|nr:hypothetical protein [Moorena sp. SIOASIH]NEO35681.1 hypothetical protein [Moorena sp. SIOASIH]
MRNYSATRNGIGKRQEAKVSFKSFSACIAILVGIVRIVVPCSLFPVPCSLWYINVLTLIGSAIV